jgi:hypothetical protein
VKQLSQQAMGSSILPVVSNIDMEILKSWQQMVIMRNLCGLRM